MSFLFWFAEKERELTDAHAEIKALKVTERSREKAFEEVWNFVFLIYFCCFYGFSSECIFVTSSLICGIYYLY